ncbi:MAG: ribosome small subunit-dependent GTPase A [Pseudomonadota bacterium]
MSARKNPRDRQRVFKSANLNRGATEERVAGIVVCHLGKSLAVETDTGAIIACHTRRRLETAAVGDRVLWEPCEGGGRVMEILPRRSLLSRPARNGKTRPVVANLDRILVVFSVQPAVDFLLVDQYLVVCENLKLDAVLVFNKIDLASRKDKMALAEELSIYRDNGYDIHSISAKTGEGIDNLKRTLKNHTSMLAGQSGVGKSSVTNAIMPDRNLRVGRLSETSGHGKHTTTTTTLYHLPEGGDLIDSPGVAIFGLAETTGKDLAWGFREFHPYIPRCQFNDCRHIGDKGCAVLEAVESGAISRKRYERFLKLREKLPKAG